MTNFLTNGPIGPTIRANSYNMFLDIPSVAMIGNVLTLLPNDTQKLEQWLVKLSVASLPTKTQQKFKVL